MLVQIAGDPVTSETVSAVINAVVRRYYERGTSSLRTQPPRHCERSLLVIANAAPSSLRTQPPRHCERSLLVIANAASSSLQTQPPRHCERSLLVIARRPQADAAILSGNRGV
jgi:hypothetical protein